MASFLKALSFKRQPQTVEAPSKAPPAQQAQVCCQGTVQPGPRGKAEHSLSSSAVLAPRGQQEHPPAPLALHQPPPPALSQPCRGDQRQGPLSPTLQLQWVPRECHVGQEWWCTPTEAGETLPSALSLHQHPAHTWTPWTHTGAGPVLKNS